MAGTFAGNWCVNLMSILIVTSIFASQLSFRNTINRYSLAAALLQIDRVIAAVVLRRVNPAAYQRVGHAE